MQLPGQFVLGEWAIVYTCYKMVKGRLCHTLSRTGLMVQPHNCDMILCCGLLAYLLWSNVGHQNHAPIGIWHNNTTYQFQDYISNAGNICTVGTTWTDYYYSNYSNICPWCGKWWDQNVHTKNSSVHICPIKKKWVSFALDIEGLYYIHWGGKNQYAVYDSPHNGSGLYHSYSSTLRLLLQNNMTSALSLKEIVNVFYKDTIGKLKESIKWKVCSHLQPET